MSLLKLLLVAASFNSLSWIIIIPIWQYPDEQAHFAQIQYIAEAGGIPQDNQSFDTSLEVATSETILGTQRDDFGNNKFTYHPEFKLNYSNTTLGPQEKEITKMPRSARSQFVKNEATLNPPLYYKLSAQVYKIFSFGNLFTRVIAIRIFSSLIFLTTIIIAYQIGKLIFKKEEILAVALAAIVATKPMLVFASTGVLPDTMTIFLFSLFIYLCLKTISFGPSIQKALGILLVIILGAATRQNFLIVVSYLPLLLIYFLLFYKKLRIKIMVIFLTFLIVLYITSFFSPALDFIHRLDFPESSRKIPGNPLAHLTYTDHLTWTIRHSIAEVWPWYWGVYKWLSLTLPPVVYQIINRMVPFAVFGLLIQIIKIKSGKFTKEKFQFLFLCTVPIVYFLALTTFDYFYRKNNGFSFGIQGRYFFPVVIPPLALILVGFNVLTQTFLRTYQKFVFLVVVLSFILFDIFTLAFLASYYYDTSSLSIFTNQVSQYKPAILKGNIIPVILISSLLATALFLFSFTKYIIFKYSGSKYERISRTGV